MNARLDRVADASIVVTMLLVGFFVLRSSNGTAPPPDGRLSLSAVSDFDELFSVGHVRGAAEPRVRIVEFGDYQCPACRVTERWLEAALATHAGRLAVSYRHYPLSYHEYAVGAARGAECAETQGRFDAFHRELFASEDWRRNDRDFAARLLAVAARVDIPNLDQFVNCIGDLVATKRIRADRVAGDQLGIRGTPTIFVEGYRIDGSPDSAQIDSLVSALSRGAR